MKQVRLFILILLTAPWVCLILHAQEEPDGRSGAPPVAGQPQPQVDESQLAMQLFQAREFEKSAELYKKLFQERPSSYYYMYYLHSLVELKAFKEAERLIREQRKRDPKAVKYLVDLGYLQYREGKGEKAVRLYDEALDGLEANQHQINELANAFLMKGENGYAIKTYLKGRDLLENSYPFSLEIATVYQRTGDDARLIEEYLNLLLFRDSYLQLVEDRLQILLADDPDNSRNELFRTALLTRVQQQPDQPVYVDLLWWYSIQQKDFELALIQTKALDRRRQEQGDRILQLAQLAAANEQYSVALDAYDYLLAKGASHPYYIYCLVERANTRFQQLTSSPAPTEREITKLAEECHMLLSEVGMSRQTVSLMQHLAHLEAFYLNHPEEAIDLLSNAVVLPDTDPRQRAMAKLELGDLHLFFDDVWEATLLYQQVYQDFKYDVIGQVAKFKNTKLSFYIGEFDWAKAQADILKASTDKLIANDALALAILIGENIGPDSSTVALSVYARADKLFARNADEEGLQVLDSIPAFFNQHPIFDDILLKKAEIFQKNGEYHVADSLLQRIVTEYPDDVLADKALYLRAGLQENHHGNPDLARELYLQLLTTYPGSIYVIDSRKRIRALRGE